MVLTRTRSRHPQDSTKFPAKQLFILALVRVAEPIALTSIFPYAWQLVLDFRVGDRAHASFYAGLLIAAFALAESMTGMFWGACSDRIGRKPVLLMGCFGTIACLLTVGFSRNFWMALCGRLLGGALNGSIGCVQTMVGELVTNPKHEPRAYAIMPFVWSVGIIIGPCIGGYFATPCKNFSGSIVDIPFFEKFPYLLPNVLCTVLMLVSIVAGYCCLEETLPGMHTQLVPLVVDETTTKPQLMSTQPTSGSPIATINHGSYGTFITPSTERWDVADSELSGPPCIIRPKWCSRRVTMLMVALGIYTYHSMTFDHLQPIFMQDPRKVDAGEMLALLVRATTTSGSMAGGLGLSIKAVGGILAVNGLIALVVQAVVFPLLAGWLGIRRTLLLVTLLHPLAYISVPFLVYLPSSWLYPGIYACLALRGLLSLTAYPLLLILIKEAAPSPLCLGRINGLAAATGAGCRTVASPMAGLLYGFGGEMGCTGLAWWASALVALCGAAQVLAIDFDAPAASCRRSSPTAATDWTADHEAGKDGE